MEFVENPSLPVSISSRTQALRCEYGSMSCGHSVCPDKYICYISSGRSWRCHQRVVTNLALPLHEVSFYWCKKYGDACASSQCSLTVSLYALQCVCQQGKSRQNLSRPNLMQIDLSSFTIKLAPSLIKSISLQCRVDFLSKFVLVC